MPRPARLLRSWPLTMSLVDVEALLVFDDTCSRSIHGDKRSVSSSLSQMLSSSSRSKGEYGGVSIGFNERRGDTSLSSL